MQDMTLTRRRGADPAHLGMHPSDGGAVHIGPDGFERGSGPASLDLMRSRRSSGDQTLLRRNSDSCSQSGRQATRTRAFFQPVRLAKRASALQATRRSAWPASHSSAGLSVKSLPSPDTRAQSVRNRESRPVRRQGLLCFRFDGSRLAGGCFASASFSKIF